MNSGMTIQFAANLIRARGFYVWQDMQAGYSLHITAERNSPVILASIKTARGLTCKVSDVLAALNKAGKQE